MNADFEKIPTNMLELGLSALTHANRLSAYQEDTNDKWAELSVLQAAHAAEILIKAKIAEEHPLIIFENFPKITDEQLSINALFEEGHTVEWSNLPNILWAATGIHIDREAFNKFGKLRNGIQHFGIVPSAISPSLETMKFIYKIIDPFINACWHKYAIDYDEDSDPYVNFLPVLIYYEIKFIISPGAARCHEYWEEALQETSQEYREIMQKRLREALKEEPPCN